MSTQPSPDDKATLTGDAIIEIVAMHKWFGEFHVLQDINLTVQKQERIVICGPSGSGKSTLIRCINRLEEHQRGNCTGAKKGAGQICLDDIRPALKRHRVDRPDLAQDARIVECDVEPAEA